MNSIIVDLGSSTIKIGYNNEELPKFELPSYIGETHDNIIDGKIIRDENKTYISSSCNQILDSLKLYYPIKNGTFKNKNDINLIFDFLFKQLGIASPAEMNSHQILITEPIFNGIQNKKNISEYLFEKLGIPAVFFGCQPILSLLGTGRTSGVILESGDNITQCGIVKEGSSLPSTFRRYNYGGSNVTEYFQELLQRRGYFFYNSSSYQLVKLIKETISRTKDYKLPEGTEDNEYCNLPDGSMIRIGDEKKKCTDILFDLDLLGNKNSTMDKMIYDSINSVDIELRLKLFGEILLSGGNTSIKGFPETLHKEIKNRINRKIKVRLYTPPKPQYCSWIGGKVITSLDDFKNMWITKAEWDEKGEKIFKEKTI
jgi:actin-related protein